MTGQTNSQAVQRYRPRPLRHQTSVSVSGIDLSKNKRELLVSYENDQVRFTINTLSLLGVITFFVTYPLRLSSSLKVYTFPIFPKASASRPTIADIDSSSDKKAGKPIPELAQYGGHLNRLTFLKVSLDCLSQASFRCYPHPTDPCLPRILLLTECKVCRSK